MENVREIHGIGSKKADELHKFYNIRTIGALRRYVKKIPDIITNSQREGLKYHSKINNDISFSIADKHAKLIKRHVPRAIIAGSYRRNVRRIGDLDVIIVGDICRVVDKLIKVNYIISTLSSGSDKFSGIVRLPGTIRYRRIDIIKTTPEEKPFALLYFTGSVAQNILMRKKAKSMGYILSQHGLIDKRTKKKIKNIKTERDIFKFLKLTYKPPEER